MKMKMKRKRAAGKTRKPRVEAAPSRPPSAALVRPVSPLPSGHAPSWQGARSDLDLARRQLAQALPAVERASAEIAALRDHGAAVARLEVARRLVASPNGGALSLLAALAAGGGSGVEADRGIAALVLTDLCEALGVTRVHEAGEALRLGADELAEMEVLGTAAGAGGGEHTVVRSGWRLGAILLARPVVAAAAPRGTEA